MHNRTKKSIIQQILRTAGIALAGIIAILFIYVLISVIGIRREILQIADSYLYSSGTSVDHKIENLEWLGKDLLYNNDKYVILQSGSESERYYALRDIRRQLMDRTAFVDEIDFVAVMEGKYGQKVYTDRRGLSESVREQLLQLVKTACVVVLST